MYQSVLGRTADAGGLNFWMSKAAGGVTLDDIRSAMMQSDEYRGSLRGYANGGDHPGGLRLVGEHGPEVEATGPSRIWSTSKMSQIFGQAEATAIMKELLTEIRQMRVEQRVGDQANVVATKAQTRFLRDLTDDGTALKTKTTT
jgi:hypothetical protein